MTTRTITYALPSGSAKIIHVYPINDTLPHITEGIGCPCHPQVEDVEGGTLIIHNSYDGRELTEQPVMSA